MKQYFYSALLFLSSCSFDFSKDDLQTVKENFESGKALIIDTRSIDEWNAGHIIGAKRYTVDDLKKLRDEGKLEAEFPKDKIIYTHCMAGFRAQKGADILKGAGFKAKSLKQGPADFVKAGFPSNK